MRKLPPAHTLTWEGGRSTLRRYWRLDYAQKADSDLPDLEDELRTRIAAAVRRRMIADVPLGAFLSGGIDSSIVVSEMASQASEPVKTFSIGFDHEEYSELPRARLIADQFHTDHTEFVVHPSAVELLPKMVRHYGEPYADSSAIPSFYLAELTRRQVTVALNGDGGDESFAGYLRHSANAMTGWIDHVPRRLRAGVGRARAARTPSRRATGGADVRDAVSDEPPPRMRRSATRRTSGSSMPPSGRRCWHPTCSRWWIQPALLMSFGVPGKRRPGARGWTWCCRPTSRRTCPATC